MNQGTNEPMDANYNLMGNLKGKSEKMQEEPENGVVGWS